MLKRILRIPLKYPLATGVLLLMVVEGVALTLTMPKPPKPVATEATKDPADRLAEVPLGDFKVRNHQIPGDDYVIKFSLCLTTAPKNKEQLELWCKERAQRVREAVSIVARRARTEMLSESTLATLKRRMRMAIISAIDQHDGPEFDVLLPDFTMQKG